ncbi:ArsR/SmtB family transcription factor [Streptomyces termitum]|uniref:Transcriptional regulator n=1 Tax=Streptomyces termitum TaxID=67368 RepID=A0A918WDE7_9ACTN|nr:winged helix-turn-helix domain-containing protein [Streptomyces termitum]GHB05986.1 transcriptional regulator [Streptomyces termitum]
METRTERDGTGLAERLTALEARVAALESPAPPPPAAEYEGDFWALDGWKDRLAASGGPDGGVLYTGAVRLPTGERYEWQTGALTADLLDEEGPAESLAALGHPVRLRLLREILGGRRTAAELSGLEDLGTTGQIYHHLRQLTAAGWLRAAGRAHHEVPPERVVPLLVVLAAARR